MHYDDDDDLILDDDVAEEIANRDGEEAAHKAIANPRGYIEGLKGKGGADRPLDETPDGEGSDAGDADDDPNAEAFVNPFAEQGVPDFMMIDEKTGKPYENGLIEGKYKTPEDAWKGFKESKKLIGKKEDSSDAMPSLLPESGFPQQLTPEERKYLKDVTYSEVLNRFAGEISERGFDPEDYRKLEDFTQLRDQDRSLYDTIQRALDEEFPERQKKVLEYSQTYAQRDTLNDNGVDKGVELWAKDLEEISGIEPDEEDISMLRERWDDDLTEIKNFDKKVQDAMLSQPGYNPYENPQILDWYNKYFTFTDSGVPILSEEKLHRELSIRHRDVAQTVLQNAADKRAADKFQKAMTDDRSERTDFPASIGNDQESSLTGNHLPTFTLADWESGEMNWDDLVEAHGGDEDAAQKYFDSVMERENKREIASPRHTGNEY